MLLVYGEVRKNRREAKALYGQRYPDRAQPHDKYFPWLERHLKTERIEEEPNEFIVSEEAEINTLACIEPFKYQVHHHLYEADHQRRLEFCNWFMVQQRPNLSRFILSSDESRFTNLGMFNKNNSRYWARENPHLYRQGAFQERFGVNVWMGVIGRRIVGPIFFENPLTADQYLQFLSNEIADFIENLPINEYFHIYYQQDGAPAHNARRVRDYLNQTFEDRWIGCLLTNLQDTWYLVLRSIDPEELLGLVTLLSVNARKHSPIPAADSDGLISHPRLQQKLGSGEGRKFILSQNISYNVTNSPNAAMFLANLVVITPSADITRAYVSTFSSFHRRFDSIDRFSVSFVPQMR
ncbi:hypothetical protein NQ318_015975 [Aromia moschata]|uniref:Transposable element Tc3 transposase n=1 Tax=Aromia moschata TaxID=1265417 RepID=A0AAV8XG11_9CUCU|nr:hypothetical protein NQ318_015975 [Aromia moschata]